MQYFANPLNQDFIHEKTNKHRKHIKCPVMCFVWADLTSLSQYVYIMLVGNLIVHPYKAGLKMENVNKKWLWWFINLINQYFIHRGTQKTCQLLKLIYISWEILLWICWQQHIRKFRKGATKGLKTGTDSLLLKRNSRGNMLQKFWLIGIRSVT